MGTKYGVTASTRRRARNIAVGGSFIERVLGLIGTARDELRE